DPAQRESGGARRRRAFARPDAAAVPRRCFRAAYPAGRSRRCRGRYPRRDARLTPMQRPREWLEETHSAGFELRRHFFLRFFDSDLVSTPGQWQVVAGGVLAILLSLSVIYIQAYYAKYLALNSLPSPEKLRLATLADVLFLVTLAMFLIGLFTTLQWPSLFPGLRDYLALGSLPVRLRDVFVAKFAALVAFASLFIVATT